MAISFFWKEKGHEQLRRHHFPCTGQVAICGAHRGHSGDLVTLEPMPKMAGAAAQRQPQLRAAAGVLVVLSLFSIVLLERSGRQFDESRNPVLIAARAAAGIPSGLRAEKVAQLYREESQDAAEEEAAVDADRPQAAHRYKLEAAQAAAVLRRAAARQIDAMTATRLGKQDAEISALKRKLHALEKTEVPGISNAAVDLRSEADIDQAIGEAVLKDDPTDRARLAHELEQHKHLNLARQLGALHTSGDRARSVQRSAFGLPVLTKDDAKKLPGVNVGQWSDSRVTLARQYGAGQEEQAETLEHKKWKLSNSQLRMVVGILDR